MGFRRRFRGGREGELVSLADLPVGSEGIVSHLWGGRGFLSKLYGIGIGVGARVKVLANDFRGVLISVGGAKYVLGRGIASKIFVKVLD